MVQPPFIGIYLAAGFSRRMGTNKLALPFGDTTLGSSALGQALRSRLQHVAIVTRPEDGMEWLDASFHDEAWAGRWSRVVCEDAFEGQSRSLISGLKACEARQAGAAVVLLADQPFVTKRVIDELVGRFLAARQEGRPCAYVAAAYQGVTMPPLLLARELFPELMRSEGDQGARGFIRSGKAGEGHIVDYEEPSLFCDIDTMEDYHSAIRMVSEG